MQGFLYLFFLARHIIGITQCGHVTKGDNEYLVGS